jgi:hypothetical protein
MPQAQTTWRLLKHAPAFSLPRAPRNQAASSRDAGGPMRCPFQVFVVLCDENGIGGGGEYFGENDLQLDRINALYRARTRTRAYTNPNGTEANVYHEASGGNYAPHAVLFDLEPGVIGAVSLSRRSANSPARKTSLISTANHLKRGRG